MDGEQAGKEVAEVAAEIGTEFPVGIDVQELTNRFNSQNFAVGQRGCGTALAQLGAGLAEEVVDDAEDSYDEALEVHGRLLWQQTGVAGCSPLQDSRGSRDLKTRTPGELGRKHGGFNPCSSRRACPRGR